MLRLYADCESRAAGSGEDFSGEVEKTLVLLSRIPPPGRIGGAPYRRLKLGRFAYALLYTVEGQWVMIQTVISNYHSLELILRQLRR